MPCGYLRRQGHEPTSSDLAHLSPLGWEHINLTGDYHWETSPNLGPDQFRPLRTHQYVNASVSRWVVSIKTRPPRYSVSGSLYRFSAPLLPNTHYQTPWHVNGAESVLPVNASIHRSYRGVNVMMLWAVAAKKEYATSLWATYQQWRELGAQVRKGEKSTPVVFWKFFDEDERESSEDNEHRNYKGVMARAYHVFNSAQVDGYNLSAIPRLPETERIERAEQFFNGLHADIREGGSRAFYSPAEDYIQVPPFTDFKKADFRYSVLGHEVTHWSGATTRLNRNLAARFQKEAYAAEELIAELGSAFVCAELELAIEARRDHAPYIQSWLNVLRNDRRAIFTAATKAQQAVDWLFKRNVNLEEAAA